MQLSAEWRISLLDAVRDIQYGMQPDTAVVPLRALLTDDFAEITQHEQRISRRVGEMRSITQSSRLSSLNGEPVNDYLADLRCAVRSIEINTLEMQMRQILWIRAHGLENAATRANEQRLAELSAAISAAPVPRDD